MVRIITQILLGLMLSFGAIALAYRFISHIKIKSVPRALYFLLLCSIASFFSVMAFYYAYSGIRELWK